MAYASRMLAPEAQAFREDFVNRMRPVFLAGAVNSVTQTLIKLAAPGVPDIYQGSETMDLSLVDPDNRRMPDYDHLQDLLDHTPDVAEPDTWLDGHLKQHVIASLLKLRQQHPDLFWHGEYLPLTIAGEKREHAVAFARKLGRQTLIVIAPRFLAAAIRQADGLPGADFWYATGVSMRDLAAEDTLVDLFSNRSFERGERLMLDDVLAERPYAVLLSGF